MNGDDLGVRDHRGLRIKDSAGEHGTVFLSGNKGRRDQGGYE
jgi:hypothetical protein